MTPDDAVALGTSADSATTDGQVGQSNGNVPGTIYDDSKVVERLDTIIKRFDSIDDALKSLQTRDTKSGETSTSTIVIDSSQYEYLQSSLSTNLYITLALALIVCALFGALLWHLFSYRWHI